ncbi:MAG TPA: NAD(P)H-dependent oxidoreductase [Candidatus Sumerlaeota bacterium]|nr:MAG: FMN-dependent NADH-azoreductase [candidate division BRC1 bacterium ADurb.Bin183]HOE64096.1 NAD(P)H-dependent oxidoreductase [Candidatus Sumerlaeota bacterium]HRR30524.1 NAD(P)H-dependent oxidoreductase [Candidatus Sumerlaeia bacterium]HON49039.1 NAD(P)H-dependent oxidoreductase [Candidatus Sumerlaeota bacterium]HOR64353.1 NAD(P)H-dependent oxidoreductase [Candidatus Sumerlaeota bacterium]
MKKLLHICAAMRGEKSRTLIVASAFLEKFNETHPDWTVETLDVFAEPLPEITRDVTDGKYLLMADGEISDILKPSWLEIKQHINRFLSADAYLISTPMWNFSIPYRLKHYIDVIAQPQYLFRYTAQGVDGLAKGRKMVVITSRGGDYTPESPICALDYQEPYLRTIFGFVGVTDITFINAQPMDARGREIMKEQLDAAQNRAREIAIKF